VGSISDEPFANVEGRNSEPFRGSINNKLDKKIPEIEYDYAPVVTEAFHME
jgi:hypothetical protein